MVEVSFIVFIRAHRSSPVTAFSPNDPQTTLKISSKNINPLESYGTKTAGLLHHKFLRILYYHARVYNHIAVNVAL